MRISEFAALLDMPKETVRFYERHGALASDRNKENGYREYGLLDFFGLMDCLAYRRLGCSVKQSVSLAQGAAMEELVEALSRNLNEINERIRMDTLSQVYLERFIETIKTIPYNIGHFWFESFQESLFMPNGRCENSEYDLNVRDLELYKRWTQKIPYVKPAVSFSIDDVSNGRTDKIESWYYTIEKQYADLFGFQADDEEVFRFPAHIGLCTIVDANAPDLMTVRYFRSLLEHAQKLPQYNSTGQMYGYILVRTMKDDGIHRYMKLVLPMAETV